MIGITGATGFVGRAVSATLERHGRPWQGYSSKGGSTAGKPTKPVELGKSVDWRPHLNGVTTLVHCAARVHQMDHQAASDEQAFQSINVEGSVALAQQAAEAGVRRFVFLSSVKVHGEETTSEHPYTHDSPCMPSDAYGRSKRDAETGLRAVASATGLELVIIRPPLVYGPGVGANFRSLMKLVASGIPLPLASIQNRRSLVHVQNLADLIIRGCDHPSAAGQSFLVSDGHDLSTPELIRALASAMGRPSRLFGVPVSLLEMAARALGREQQAQRLTRSLCVDIQHTIQTLDWRPQMTVEQGMASTVNAFSP